MEIGGSTDDQAKGHLLGLNPFGVVLVVFLIGRSGVDLGIATRAKRARDRGPKSN